VCIATTVETGNDERCKYHIPEVESGFGLNIFLVVKITTKLDVRNRPHSFSFFGSCQERGVKQHLSICEKQNNED
jgi:hypothetical protein